MSDLRTEWYAAYRRQRQLIGRALYVAADTKVTEALRVVLPLVKMVRRGRMCSGRPASMLCIYPPVRGQRP